MERRADFEAARAAFYWAIPARFNIAQAICDRHVGVRDTALITEVGTLSFRGLREMASRLANVLLAHGVMRGDRVAILLPQGIEAAAAHVAAYRMGAVALPMFPLFGPDAIEYRLRDSGARALVTSAEGMAKLDGLRPDLPELHFVLNVDADFHALLAQARPEHRMVDTAAEDPALILYTSGTTGQPKGVLHAHRVLLGMLPGVELPHEFFPQPGDRMWTPADWAWAGGLLDVLLPSLFHGVPVVALRLPKFDADAAFALMARYGVRNAFLPPTALKMMRGARVPDAVRLRSVGSGGERLGDEIMEWGRSAFGLTINEFYGQTEANLTVGGCAGLLAPSAGCMGRAYPGHEVAVLDEAAGRVVGEAGQLAVRAPDPALFLQYWGQLEATARKYVRDEAGRQWLLTGDIARADAAGNFWFLGRNDDLISSAGYRIGPDEIEQCIMRHPAVHMVAVVGVPDALRGEAVKAFVVLAAGYAAGSELASEIQAFVKSRLSPHEYPRAIEFRDALPMTVTGKIRRRDLRER